MSFYEPLSNSERVARIRDTWETYGEIHNSDLTASQLRDIEAMLDNLKALIDE